MFKITRVGDHCTHDAVVITGDSSRIVNDAKIARIGDLVACPYHGVNPIVAQAATIVATGNAHTSRIVSTTECGAQIITGSPNVLIDGSTTGK